MPYAAVAHLKARAGYLAEAWGEQTDVSDADLAIFIQDVAAEIDAAIVGLGVDIPASGSTSAKALVGLNADGALLLALDATFPAGEGPAAATELQRSVRERYNVAMKRLLDGDHPATTVVTSGATGSPSASDFWSNEPDYGRPEVEPVNPNPALDPAVARGQAW